MDTYSRQLVFHGAVVLLVGLLCGAPYGRAVNRNAPEHIVHSWRVAHGSIPLGPASAKLVYAGNVVGAVSSLLAAVVLIYVAYVSL
jgi:hypothetical protein